MQARKRIVLLLAAGVALACALGGAWCWFGGSPFDPQPLRRYYHSARLPSAQPVAAGTVQAGIDSATDYIRRFNLPSGQFVYLVNTDPALAVSGGYSVLRHAGTIYALGMSQSVRPDLRTVQVMQRAVEFLRRCCIARLDDEGVLAVWEPEELVRSSGPRRYPLGGAGLGLLALTSLESLRAGSVPLGEMKGLAAFGHFMQGFSGGFDGDYVPSQGGKWPLKVLYYPGEMVLGWLSLYEVQPDPALLDWAVGALTYLARQRAREGAAPADHWALLATARLFAIADRGKVPIPRQALLHHALQICHQMLEGNTSAELPAMKGSLVRLGVVTPTATRLEALLAALTFLPADEPIRPHIEAAVHRGIEFLLRAQVKDGPYAGGMPTAITRLPYDGTERVREFNDRATEIRIDYVQHSLSALVQYLRWTADRPHSAATP